MLSLTMSTIIRGIPASKTRIGFKGLFLPMRLRRPSEAILRTECHAALRPLQRIERCKSGPGGGPALGDRCGWTEWRRPWAKRFRPVLAGAPSRPVSRAEGGAQTRPFGPSRDRYVRAGGGWGRLSPRWHRQTLSGEAAMPLVTFQ